MTSLELSRRSFSDYDNDHSTEIFNSQEMRFCGGVKSIPLISRLFNQDYKSYPKAEHWTIKKKRKKKFQERCMTCQEWYSIHQNSNVLKENNVAPYIKKNSFKNKYLQVSFLLTQVTFSLETKVSETNYSTNWHSAVSRFNI